MSGEIRATQSANDYIGYTVADMVTENADLYAALRASTELLQAYQINELERGVRNQGLANQIAANEAALGKVREGNGES